MKNIAPEKEKIINDFFNKFSDFKGELELRTNLLYSLMQKCKKENRMPSEFEMKKIEIDIEKSTKDIKEKEDEINKELAKFSQEMLVLIYNKSKNASISLLVEEKIRKNNFDIEFINSTSESGLIFDDIKNIKNEYLEKILKLRESDDNIIFNGRVLSNFSDDTKDIYKKKIEGKLEDAKREFFEKHNISSESEFEFYKKNYYNHEFIKNAKEAQEAINNLLKTDDNSIEEWAQDQIGKSKPKHHKK